MKITDTADNAVFKDGDIKRRVLISYPLTDGETKAAIRINGFISKIAAEYKKEAEKASLYTYNRLKYRICRADPLSVLFESERMGADGLFSYSPFSVSFTEDGYAAPFCPDKKVYRAAKRFFADRGVRVRRRDIRYSYYVTETDQTVIYAKSPSAKRAKSGIITYTLGTLN